MINKNFSSLSYEYDSKIEEKSEIKKILIIRLSALGDTIHTLPAVYALRKKFPNAQIDWIVEDKASKFIENNPLVDNVFIIKSKQKNLKSFCKIISKIRREKYDIALDFQQLLKSGIYLGLSGAKRKITLDYGREFSGLFANEIVKTGKKLFDLNYHAVKRNLDLTAVLGCNTDEIKFILPDFSNEYSEGIKKAIEKLDKTKKTIVMAPATTWDNKHWKVEEWRKLIENLKEDYNIILTASVKEKGLISEIGYGFDNITDLSGKTTIADLVYIYKKADLIISPDSGSAHTAWASGAKSIITIFFATSSKRTAPFGDNYFSISADTECSPCMKRKCKLKHNKNKCINSISADEVLKFIHL